MFSTFVVFLTYVTLMIFVTLVMLVKFFIFVVFHSSCDIPKIGHLSLLKGLSHLTFILLVMYLQLWCLGPSWNCDVMYPRTLLLIMEFMDSFGFGSDNRDYQTNNCKCFIANEKKMKFCTFYPASVCPLLLMAKHLILLSKISQSWSLD